MDQEKIGKFIQKCRKEKNMTQLDLANKINVTDRAVSNWERGRRMPDVSLFSDLCHILDITVNELIAGEKIPKNRIVKETDKNIISTFDKLKKDKKSLVRILLILFAILLLIIYKIYLCITYPKIDIYNFSVASAENISPKLKEIMHYQDSKIYYYGINDAIVCNNKDKCYHFDDTIKNKQTTLNKFKEYLEKQKEYGNVEKIGLWDGGSTIYKRSEYTVIFCNTLNSNKDIYIGKGNMINDLNGAFCGSEKSDTETFVRTYQIISISDTDSGEYWDVTLKMFQGENAFVKIRKGYDIVPGNNYEFTFVTYYDFPDTINNIFENSLILSINKTDKLGLEQINEKIKINKEI